MYIGAQSQAYKKTKEKRTKPQEGEQKEGYEMRLGFGEHLVGGRSVIEC